jgi:hypothetical protein
MLLLLEVLGITLSAFLGFGSIAWFFDQNFLIEERRFAFAGVP